MMMEKRCNREGQGGRNGAAGIGRRGKPKTMLCWLGILAEDARSEGRQRRAEIWRTTFNSFSRFLNITTAIGMLFMGVIAVKYGDTLMTPRFGQALSHGAVLALSLLATAAWCAVVLFQSSLIRISGAITLSQPFTSHLALLRRSYFALAVIITSPTLLLFALCPRGTGDVWFFVGAVELIITAVLYLRESLNLFISKKISILHWFLYLCTIETAPIAFAVLMLVKYS